MQSIPFKLCCLLKLLFCVCVIYSGTHTLPPKFYSSFLWTIFCRYILILSHLILCKICNMLVDFGFGLFKVLASATMRILCSHFISKSNYYIIYSNLYCKGNCIVWTHYEHNGIVIVVSLKTIFVTWKALKVSWTLSLHGIILIYIIIKRVHAAEFPETYWSHESESRLKH